MTLCSNAIGTNRVKFRFGDSLGFIAKGGFGDSKALPAKGLNVIHALWNLKLWRQQSRRQGENGRLLLLDGFRHPSEKSEFITTIKLSVPNGGKGGNGANGGNE